MALSLGVINAHIRAADTREKFSSIVKELELDIVVVSETWFKMDTAKKLISKVFGNNFTWFSKEHAEQKSSNCGGIGILIRKSIGDISLVKIYDSFDGLWIKYIAGADVYHICGVYLPPGTSANSSEDFSKCLQLLEADCIKFRKVGKVVIMGDFNARIGSDQSLVYGHSGDLMAFSRLVSDAQGGSGSVARTRGIQLINSMNSVNMVILNGIDSGGEFTFDGHQGSSMIDYIILSDNIMIPNVARNQMVSECKSGVVSVSDPIPLDSLYIPRSCTVWNDDNKYIINDHFLITCKLAIPKPQVQVPFQEVGEKLDTIRWVRNDKGDRNYWVPMQHALEETLEIWSSKDIQLNADQLVSDFNQHINTGLGRSLKISKQKSHGKKLLNWNPTIFRLQYEENIAFRKYNNANLAEKVALRAVWKQCTTRLKNAIRSQNRKELQHRIQKLENLKSQNPRDYWKGLYELDNTGDTDSKIPLLVKNSSNQLVGGVEASQVWMESFAKLGLEATDFHDYDSAFYVHIGQEVDKFYLQSFDTKFELDIPISIDEVRIAVKKLKKGKAVGIDGIPNEAFKYGGDQVVTYLWKLYQKIFDGEQFPTEWSRGLIFPLFKGGPEDFKLDPNKYRGITLLSIVGKTYTSVLNRRLTNFCESNNILVDEQAGFRRERSTVDQLFTLIEIIKYRRPKATYCAFIDVAKAYDKVWRKGLWYKLWKAGIRGKFWRALRNIYRKVESSVLLGDRHTAFFEIFVGLRQGCILSPILFDLFINDLRDVVDKLGKGVKIGDTRVSMLMFADDIVILAESKADLELMLKAIYEYSLKWRMKFNYEKCNVIVFEKRRGDTNRIIKHGNCVQICTCQHHFAFGPTLIKEVTVYRYLGIELDYRLTFTIFKERTMTRARMNMGRIWGMGIKSGYLSVKGSITLWQALVRSILEYGSEVWGKEQWPEGEQVQADMAKRILRCSKMTARQAMYGDLGWWKLQTRRNLKKLIYWFHIQSLPDNRLLKKVYMATKLKGKPTSWASTVGNLLNTYGLSHVWQNPQLIYNLDNKGNLEAKTISDHKQCWRRFISSKIFDHEQKSWWSDMVINGENSKLRTYVTFKKSLRLEKYLLAPSSNAGKRFHTSLRSGTNILAIDMDRRVGIHKDFRFCKQCDLKLVEDEKHFLVYCPKYAQLRNNFYQSILNITATKWNFMTRPPDEVFILLMQGTGDQFESIIFRLFHSYLEKCFKLRDPHI